MYAKYIKQEIPDLNGTGHTQAYYRMELTPMNHQEFVSLCAREGGYDESTMTLYITGGGGCLVKNFYRFNTNRVIFVDGICAAAKGYEFMAELQMQEGIIP